ncbi:MAG: hypothetical protein IJT92_00040 [Spirochaetia bacterium]|nr:hypothetical protein [Spirochaetia bacterium]
MEEHMAEVISEPKEVVAQRLIDTSEALERLAENEEKSADVIVKQLDIKEADYPKIKNTVHEFVSDYVHKDKETTDKQFLVKKFNDYPQIWKDKAEIEQTADDIVETVYNYEKNKKELDAHIASGKRRESWLATKIEQGAETAGAAQVGMYAQKMDIAIDNANRQMEQVIHNMDGSINQNPNLDGLIAEQHHANTFNLDASQKEKAFTAEPLGSNGKNSVDVVVRDERGGIVRKYQSKYGKDAETTESYFENGDYRGQRKLVPEGQSKDIKGSSDKIEYTDYKSRHPEKIESKPLSKEEAKAMQKKVQSEGKIDDYTWNNFNKGIIAKRIGIKAGIASALAVGFQGARIVGRRIWNWATGKENQSVAEDVKEFAESAVKSGASAGLTVATSGALTVAARSGWLGKLLMKTPAGHIAAAACVGIENIKVLYKFAKGELTGEQAIDQAGRATCSVVGGFAGSVKGASIGAAVGTILGPVGTAVGGIAGGLVGGIAGSVVGEAIFSAGKKIVKTVANGIKAVGTAIGNGIKAVGSAISNIGSGIKNLFGWL